MNDFHSHGSRRNSTVSKEREDSVLEFIPLHQSYYYSKGEAHQRAHTTSFVSFV